jgi:hypothetical protein
MLSIFQDYLLADKLKYRCRGSNQSTDLRRAVQETPRIEQEKRKGKYNNN